MCDCPQEPLSPQSSLRNGVACGLAEAPLQGFRLAKSQTKGTRDHSSLALGELLCSTVACAEVASRFVLSNRVARVMLSLDTPGVSGHLVGPAAFKAVEGSFARLLVGSIPIHSRPFLSSFLHGDTVEDKAGSCSQHWRTASHEERTVTRLRP